LIVVVKLSDSTIVGEPAILLEASVVGSMAEVFVQCHGKERSYHFIDADRPDNGILIVWTGRLSVTLLHLHESVAVVSDGKGPLVFPLERVAGARIKGKWTSGEHLLESGVCRHAVHFRNVERVA
jgi:hypothetical protein